MDDTRKTYRKATVQQKRKLIAFVTAHPELITNRVTPEFSYKDSHRLWSRITEECNAVPGARKTWRQWRKAFQDLRAKTKKQQKELNGGLPMSLLEFTQAEQEALGLKPALISSSDHHYHQLSQAHHKEQRTTFIMETELNNHQSSFSESETPSEVKVFSKRSKYKRKVKKVPSSSTNKETNGCSMNCELLATQENQKIRMKEDYYNFKKQYLKQKLVFMKEQTEALKSIAKELSK